MCRKHSPVSHLSHAGSTLHRMGRFALLVAGLLILLAAPPLTLRADGPIIYVDQSAAGAANGSSWADAFTDLQAALDAATGGDEIWIAAGTYRPTERGRPDDPRSATFTLQTNVALYGGFAGNESTRDERDWTANGTILSGDIGTADEPADNSYHVVVGSSTDATAVLDGVTVTGGNADGSAFPLNTGGGMLNLGGSPTVRHTIFEANRTSGAGGGMFNFSGSAPGLTDVTFRGNSAAQGGGLAFSGSQGTLVRVTFESNSANWGGGMDSGNESSVTLSDVTVLGNSAAKGGGISHRGNSEMTLRDVTFNGNTASLSGGGLYNTASTIELVDVTFNENNAVDESSGSGGGMIHRMRGTATLQNVIFRNNGAYTGGGMHISAEGSLTGVQFIGNQATLGGGLSNDFNERDLVLTDVLLAGNEASSSGGGIYNVNSISYLANVTIQGNRAESGGGMANFRDSDGTLANVIFSGNTATGDGGGFSNDDSDPILANVTFSGNVADVAGGIMSTDDSTIEVHNSIFWNNQDGSGTGADAQIQKDGSSTTVVANSLVQGGCLTDSDCTDVSDIDPQFVRDPDDGGDGWGVGDNDDFGDLRLQSDSPAIETGNNDGVAPDAPDLDGDRDTDEPLPYDREGNPRIFDYPGEGAAGVATVDLGAYEFVLANLRLDKMVTPAEAQPGEVISYTLRYENMGSQPASNVTITDDLPHALTDITVSYDGLTPSLTGEDPHTWELATVASRATGTITITGRLQEGLPAGRRVGNTATISTTGDEVDGANNQGEATLTVENAPPAAQDDSVTTPQDTAITIAILDNDNDANGDPLSITAAGTPANGSATIEGNQIRYTPASGFSGTDSFTYTVSDGELADQATLTVEVQEGEAPPGGEARLFLPAVSR